MLRKLYLRKKSGWLPMLLLGAVAWMAGPVVLAEPVILFADDFSVFEENGAPDSTKWNAPQAQHHPERRIHVVTEGISEKFGIEAGNALRIYKNEQTIEFVNTSVTAEDAFLRGSPIITVTFDFWHSSEFPGTINLRVGSGNVGNSVRVHDVPFRNGSLSNLAGMYGTDQPTRIELVMNNTALPVIYADGEVTLAPDSYDVWINRVQVISSRQQNRGRLPVGEPLTGLQFASFGNNKGEMFVRNLVVYEGAHVEPQEKQPPVEIFMAVDGSDQNDGLSLDSPIRTMAGVQTLLLTKYPQRDARIRIAPGRYHEQKVTWSYVPIDSRIVFEALDPDLPRPIFDGCAENGECNGGTWFLLSFSGGRPSNLEFRNLRIENYQTALSFNGNRNSQDLFNGGNVVEGCHFYRIGNIFNPLLDPSTAVIRLVNSKDNLIINNDFIDAINTRSGALLHAVYVAHLSDRNFILQNRFINHSGDPVRVRDFSNDNVINDNVYIRAGAAGYSEWYCDQDARDDCSKPTPECPSWGNEFRNNFLVSRYGGGTIKVWETHQPDSTTGCSPPTSDARRVRTSGNINSTTQTIDLWRHR
ncbi:MAG TPA: right-handed parallel beta-helix repeat-containing protein [Opitutales bacterium]|nr:right-handed parallel beta-helix repeat-containing protein [Opitutales bacterium]